MAKIVDTIPETAGADEQVRRRYEAPAPRRFFEALGPLVLDAHGRGEHELALRIVEALDAGLATEAANWIRHGFCEGLGGHARSEGCVDELERFLGQRPDAVRAEVQRYVTGLRDRPDQADDESIGHAQTSMPPLRWRLRHPVKWLVTGYRISG